MKDKKELIEELHRKAVERGEESYIDPETGYLVFTELFHKRRGHCCESGCRHCPYGFKKKTSE
ncbi:DUF5522 domain-containing protein [Bdellovibrio sp. 22V]|uniref:DUF5522 domain-containing protein n=1 Tax=Bdellovibrio TaxID=958 RepID=UPI0025432948|nr:DUF5522 domain-containing protein [Bdellovibrio sp. 22V]WII70816.1 DUF5522 domain-containing protein [Bdellovibrio sp. 22V]